MSLETPDSAWPPSNGRAFIRSNEFGEELIGLARELTARYPHMDFTDAVAQVFAWFDRKLANNRRFINKRRFRTRNAFRAYLRQALWNAARLVIRARRRREHIEALAVDQPVGAWAASPEIQMRVLEAIERLPEPHKTVFERCFFEEDALGDIAIALRRNVRDVESLYEEAVDMLAKALP